MWQVTNPQGLREHFTFQTAATTRLFFYKPQTWRTTGHSLCCCSSPLQSVLSRLCSYWGGFYISERVYPGMEEPKNSTGILFWLWLGLFSFKESVSNSFILVFVLCYGTSPFRTTEITWFSNTVKFISYSFIRLHDPDHVICRVARAQENRMKCLW